MSFDSWWEDPDTSGVKDWMLLRGWWVMVLVGLVFMDPGSVAAQSNPVKMASLGRFDLSASSGVGGLSEGALVVGEGSVARQTWRPVGDQARTYTVNVGVTHFGWREVVFRFVPESSGTVTVTLMGPWEESLSGPIYRQEVLWDAVTGVDVNVQNGGFEQVSGVVPVSWTRPYGDGRVETGPVAAVEGQRYARTWHDSPLGQTWSVTGGMAVTIRLYVRAQVPDGFSDMVRIEDPDSAAHRSALRFMRGVNLGNYLEAPRGEDWGMRYGVTDFQRIRAEGFDHVRLPVAWHHYAGAGPEYELEPGIFEKVDFMVTNALRQELGVIVNVHHFDAFTSDPAGQAVKFRELWRQIAAHYAASPGGVAFELLNEPKDAATTAVLNPIYESTVRLIRETNPERAIFIGPGLWNSIHELAQLRLPGDDDHLIVTVHCYDPFLFTHQGASWTGADTATRGVVYPGPPATPLSAAVGVASWVRDWIEAYNTLPESENPSSVRAFRGKFELAREWSDYYGRPVHVGEFGAYELADAASRARFYREMRTTLDGLGLGWAAWDWKAGFHYWNNATQQPAVGLREAMFPAPRLMSRAPGRLELDGAVGKVYRIDRVLSLEEPAGWEAVTTQRLERPFLDYLDEAGLSIGSNGFYRATWLR